MLFYPCDSLPIQAYCYSCINISLTLTDLFHNFWYVKVFLYLRFLNIAVFDVVCTVHHITMCV